MSASPVRRVAAIDIGTNSVLLVIADDTEHGPVPVLERATITRLGKGVDRARRLDPGAVQRTLSCLSDYAEAIREHGVETLDIVGTSAMRDAEGAEGFRRSVRDLLGVEPRTIAGSEEAALTFAGATSGLAVSGAITVFDIGGGSTEVISGSVSDGVARADEGAVSLDVGSVRMTERHVRSDPPSARELAAIRDEVRAELRSASVSPTGKLVGVAGTVTTLAAVSLGAERYDSAIVHGLRLSAETLAGVTDRLAAMPLAVRREVPGLEPARADVIVAGATIATCILESARGDSFVVSDRGVRWGLVAQLLAD